MSDRDVLLEMFERAGLDYCRFEEQKNDTLYVLSAGVHFGFYFNELNGDLVQVRHEGYET